MKQPKNHITLLLMVSSVLLLLALQVFWLTNSYERAYFDMRKEANNLFRSTVTAMRDSMFVKQFERVPSDSIRTGRNYVIAAHDSVAVAGDSMKFKYKRTASQIQIFLRSNSKDSLHSLLKPFASRLQEGGYGNGGTFVVRVGSDSLSLDSIRHEYQKAIAPVFGSLSIDVRHDSFVPTPVLMNKNNPGIFKRFEDGPDESEPEVFSNNLQTEWVRLDPMHRYSVVLSGFQGILLAQIAPQILFSIFLSLLTIVSFGVVYRSLRTQQRLMALKNDFISNVTHELKTPIATVSVALEALQNFKGLDNPQLTREYLAIAQQELQRLTLLTDKVLTTSLFDEHGIRIDLESVDLEKTTNSILSSLKLVFEKREASVQLEKTGSDFVLQGSAVHLTNVIHNLLDNALKYSPTQPLLHVTLRDLGEKVSISVQDHGAGIPPEYHKKVFEKFFRMPTGDVHTIKGYGLGLSYVEGVVTAHGGTIELASTVGKGSTFTVTLPKRTPNAKH